MPFDTLEEAQAEILRLQGVNTELTNERDTLSQNNKALTEDLEKVRTLNQNYFNRLVAQSSPQTEKEDDTPDAPSCEEFAKTIKI